MAVFLKQFICMTGHTCKACLVEWSLRGLTTATVWKLLDYLDQVQQLRY